MSKVPIIKAIFFAQFFLPGIIAHAQIKKPGIILGGYLLYAKPQGDFNKAYNFGGGGEVFGGAGLGKTFIIGTAGFSAFKLKSGIRSGTLTYVPLKMGLRQYLFKKIVFVNADLGIALVKNNDFNASRFIRGIGFGAKLLGLEAGLYYDGWKNKNVPGFSNNIDFKAGWSFSL